MPNLRALPHRHPFCFLSSVESLELGDRGLARWDVTGDEDFFEGHFPGNPLVPGVLLTESLAQLSGMVAFTDDDVAGTPPPQLAQINVKFLQTVRPPASIHLKSRLTRRIAGLCLFEVQAVVQGAVAAKGTVVLAHQDTAASKTGPE